MQFQATDADANNTNKKAIFNNCASFTSCMSRINNTQKDDAQYIDVVMPMQNLIELVIIIQKHLEFYGSIAEMNQLKILIIILLIY